LHGIREPERVQLSVGREVVTAVTHYDPHSETFQVQDIALPKGQTLHLALATNEKTLLSRRDRIDEKCGDMLHAFRLQTVTKAGIAEYLPHVRANPDLLGEFTPNLSENQMRALLDIIVNNT